MGQSHLPDSSAFACRRRLLPVAAAVKSVVAIENVGDAITQIAQTTHEARATAR
jgi:hypothetical protein